MSLLIGDTYLHRPSGQLLVVLGREYRRATRSRGRRPTGRLIVRPANARVWEVFVVDSKDLVESPVPPARALLP